MHIAFGEDTYGAVRRVERTSIVTKFFMLQMLPVYPLESYYLVRLGRSTELGIPLLASMSERKIVGLPLRQLDRLSVFVSYIRAVGAVVVVIPAIFLILCIISWLCDPHIRLDEDGRLALSILEIVFALGLTLTLSTYYLTFHVPARERAIRRASARVLGVAADLAFVQQDLLLDIDKRIDAVFAERGISGLDEVIQRANSFERDVLELALARTRSRLGQGDAADARESETDILLRAIEFVPQN